MRLEDLEEGNKLLIEQLGLSLNSEFFENKILRREKETEWTESLRQCKGKYDPDVLLKLPKTSSQVYVKYTRYKESALRSILNNIVLSDNDKNWTMKPTKKPGLSKEVAKEIVDSILVLKKQIAMSAGQQEGQPNISGEDIKVTEKEFEQAASQYAKARCEKMEIEMDDQLEEIGIRAIQKSVIKSGIRYGCGIIEGPFAYKKKDVHYEETPTGFEVREGESHTPSGEALRIWDCYPDMTVVNLEDCDYIWTRKILNKHQLRALAKKQGFFEDVILNFIREKPSGNAAYEQWEIDIETVDKTKIRDTRVGKYELLCRWGNIDATYVRAMGFNVEEEALDGEMFCNIWLLGNRVIKFIKNPLPVNMDSLTDIYHFFYFDKDETSIFGTGLPKIARDMELTMGGAMRQTLNNAAKVAGPQTIVNTDLLAPDEDPEDVAPGRVWKRWGRGIDAQYDAVKPLEFESHVTELMSIFDKAMSIADLELSIPMWLHTEPDKGTGEKNFSEIAAKWPMHTISIKEVIKSFDNCNESFLDSLYKWNMEFNKNNDIKGEYKVITRGSTALLMKELKTQALIMFSQSLSPEERIYIKTGNFLREKIKMMVTDDLSEFLHTDEEVEQIKASMQDKESADLAKKMQEAEVFYTIAKGKHMESKANKTTKDSDLDVIDRLIPSL